MSRELTNLYSNLKEVVLRMRCDAIGVQTLTDFYVRNCENFFKILRLPFNQWIKNELKLLIYQCFENLIFETNFEGYFDDQMPFELDREILTGSMSEGLFLLSAKAPDIDVMCVLKNIAFSQKDQEDGSLVLRNDTPFVYAFLANKETQNLWKDYLDEADDKENWRRLSSRKLKEKLKKNYEKTGSLLVTSHKEKLEEVTEGAAVTIRRLQPVLPSSEKLTEIILDFWSMPIGAGSDQMKDHMLFLEQIMVSTIRSILPLRDIVLSIFCEGWPICAKEWLNRERFWPDKHQIENIAQSGFHIVPKSSTDGDFRLSFSCAETMLIKTLSPLQHRVMKAFKAVIKYHQVLWGQSYQVMDEIITSYHLKTIAFWHFEKTSQESFTEDTIVHHLVALLEELAEALRTQTLPMYFMPKYNLFREIDDHEAMIERMANVYQLSCDFSAILEGVYNNSSGFYYSDALVDILSDINWEKIFNVLREKKLKKEQGEESPLTFYDLFELLKKKDFDPFIFYSIFSRKQEKFA